MPPKTEPGEIEVDLGLTPASTPIADTDAPDTTGEKDAQLTSGGQDTTTPADGPKSMADAITQALAGDAPKAEGEAATDPENPDAGAAEKKPEAEKPADPAVTPDPAASKEPAETADTLEDDPSEEELKGYNPKVQKRIRKLLSQRNEFRRTAEGLNEDAGHYRNIRQFMSESRLEDGEVAELFKVGRLLKGNDIAGYEEALNIVLPIAQQLLEWTGRSVPTDLREKVENGELTEDAAREMAAARSRATVAERKATEVTKTAAAQQQVQQTSAMQSAIQTAVSTWEQRVQASDPDFGLKTEAMRNAALALVAERGRPKNPEEAVKFAQDAYDRVSNWFKSARPKQQPSRPAPGNGQTGTRAGLAPAPKSLQDAITGALKASAR